MRALLPSSILLGLGVALASAACLPRTVVGVDDVGGAGGGVPAVVVSSSVTGSHPTTGVTTSSSVTPGTGGAGGGSPSVIALLGSELPPDAHPCGFQQCTIAADALFLLFDSDGNSCQMPLGTYNATTTNWSRILGLPVQYQAVGTYTIGDPAIYYENAFFEHSQGSGVGQTSGGLGTGMGTVEVLSIDKTQITVRIAGSETSLGFDGDYVVPRCTPLP